MKNKTKKMDIDENLHMEIYDIQSKLFKKFRVKVNLHDITNETICLGLKNVEKSISEKLRKELIIYPIEV